ncbi:ATP-dependent DNA ligase [Nocardia kruczakiae]|uniref:ATP-dependent DNA ligase n=1 Tax=Nocardia kruczakiae TaxID=261477 RepID=UPI000A66D6CD|nr:hypothetical protein [Nocardia kruczakiae]
MLVSRVWWVVPLRHWVIAGGTLLGVGRVPAPMLATAGRPPENSDQWATEMKWDGMRAITSLDNGEPRLYSRNGREATASFPELTAALADTATGRRFVIDGEVAAPELPTGIPSFRRLQHRMHTARPPAGLIASIPVQLFVFDILAVDDTDTTPLTYVQRRDLLADLDLASTAAALDRYRARAAARHRRRARPRGYRVQAPGLDLPARPAITLVDHSLHFASGLAERAEEL